ncbi:MAG: hypothetical protein ABJA10_02350 [Aestuariivirga sp.]
MASLLSNHWNFATAYLEMFHRDKYLGCGSGFFWKHEQKTLLITNWHNLAGINPETGMWMQSGRPDRLRLWIYKSVSEPDPQGNFNMQYVSVDCTLCDENLNNVKWLEHPQLGKNVDIGALDVTQDVQGAVTNCVNVIESDAVIDVFASQDVFVIGFPFGRIANAPAPIWKRGTIALDPGFDPGGMPKMFIDTATRPGMSGSVVVARHIIIGADYLKRDGTRSEKFLYASCNSVVGVYSGRLNPDFEKAQLGIVWRRSAIEETVSGLQIANV